MAEEEVLVIEDDCQVATLIRRCLASAGVGCTVCANGAAGLSALARGGHSILLVDGDSLAGDGHALLDAARDAGPVPLIVITESGASADLGPWWRVGALRVISKPFSVATLNRCVRELLCDARAGDPGAGP